MSLDHVRHFLMGANSDFMALSCHLLKYSLAKSMPRRSYIALKLCLQPYALPAFNSLDNASSATRQCV